MEHTQADLLTIWPTRYTYTWGGGWSSPLNPGHSWLTCPCRWYITHLPWPAFAAANGQCLAFRRRAYQTRRSCRPAQ
ncbi:MAG: hypothetical protein U0401_12880 [Anaerolineae bacterium]